MNKPSNDSGAAGPLSRRTVFASAGSAGALAAVAAWLPRRQPDPTAVSAAPPEDAAQGYRLSEHVQRYYRSARV